MQRTPWFRIWFCLGLILCLASFFADDWTIAWVADHRLTRLRHLSSFITRWGDFVPIATLLALLLIVARLARSETWTRLLGLMFCSAVASGLLANLLRITTCRARPLAHIPAGWYGLQVGLRSACFRYQYASFPSAHTAVAVGAALPLIFFVRQPWALFGILMAMAVAASRVYLDAHHLSDVMVAALLGGTVSWAVCFKAPFGTLAEKWRKPFPGLALPAEPAAVLEPPAVS